jgi:hypothetical protein
MVEKRDVVSGKARSELKYFTPLTTIRWASIFDIPL